MINFRPASTVVQRFDKNILKETFGLYAHVKLFNIYHNDKKSFVYSSEYSIIVFFNFNLRKFAFINATFIILKKTLFLKVIIRIMK